MISALNSNYVLIVPPGAVVDDTSYVASLVDTLGYAFVQIIVAIGATDIAMAALKIQQSDEADDNFTDVPGLIFGTSTNIAGNTSTLPSADSAGDLFVFDINAIGKKRYLKLVATAGDGSAGTYLTAFANRSRAAEPPSTTTERGATQILRA